MKRWSRKSDPTKSITYAQAAQKAIELGGKFGGKEVPEDINPITKDGVAMIAGTGLIGVAKDNLPRVGVTPGLAVGFVEIELDVETGKFDDHGHAVRRGLRHRAASAGPGAPDQRRQCHGHRPGDARTPYLRPEARHSRPRCCSTRRSRRPTSTFPAEIGWGAVEKPDPQNPIGVKGVGEPVQGSGPPRSRRRSPMPSAGICSTARRCRPT